MNLLRDPEIKKELLVFLLLTVLLAGGLCFFSLWAGALALGGGLLFTGMHLLCLSRRCRDMETLSRELDAILHGQQELLLYQYKEGGAFHTPFSDTEDDPYAQGTDRSPDPG